MEMHPVVTRISSPIFEESTEIYLIRSDRNVLIDTGIQHSPHNDIAPALGKFGLTLADIDLVLNTHGHPDHTGGNAIVKNESNAQIFIHSEDAIFVQDHERSYEQFIAPVSEVILGKEALKRDRANFLGMSGPDVFVDRPLENDDLIDLGKGCQLRVVHMPGHTSGCVGFYWEKEGILFSGDSLPGLHTENLGLPIISDFKAYDMTLDHMKGLAVRILLQAHPFRGLNLPPSPIKQGVEVDEYLQDCRQMAAWIRESVTRLAPYVKEMPFMDFADRVIAALPEKTDFKPMSQIPLPRYNALTILSALKNMDH